MNNPDTTKPYSRSRLEEYRQMNVDLSTKLQYELDIKRHTETIRRKHEDIHTFAVELGLEDVFCEKCGRADDYTLFENAKDIWMNAHVSQSKAAQSMGWKDFTRFWLQAYGWRGSIYMEKAGAHKDNYRWCRRCNVKRLEDWWDYGAEISNYTLAIEDYINTIRLQWGSPSGIYSRGDAFADAVKEYLCAPQRRSIPTESQHIIRSKSVQKQNVNACVCHLFSNYERCHNNDHNRYIDNDLEPPCFIRKNKQTDIFITLQSAHLCKAEACFDAKQYERSVEEYTKLIRLSPDDHYCSAWVYPIVYINRAKALLCLDRKEEARADFEEALRFDCDNEIVKEALSEIDSIVKK